MNTVSIRTSCRTVLCILPLWMCAAASLFADVSIRYKTDIKLASFLPPQAQEQTKKMMAGAGDYVMYMKDGKGLASVGALTSLVDFPKQQMVLMNSSEHTMASLPVAELGEAMAGMMPPMPEEAKTALAAMKFSVDTKKTGRTDTILGIQAEEREMTFSIEMPLPGHPGQSDMNQSGMKMRTVMNVWTAKPEEALHNQAIRELMGYNLYANRFMNPGAMLQGMYASMPQMGEALKSLTDELSQGRVVILRTHTAVYMQMPPDVQKAMAAKGGVAGSPMDFSAPLTETTQEVVELSSDKVSETLFQIPTDYKSVPAADVMKSIFKNLAASMPVAK